MPRGVRKIISYSDELKKIEEQMQALEAKKNELLAKKNDEDMKALSEFIQQNSMTAEDAIAILAPAVAASTQNPSKKV